MSIEVPPESERYVNGFDVFEQKYRELCKNRYKYKLTREDCDEAANSYCEHAAYKLINESKNYSRNIELISRKDNKSLIALEFNIRHGNLFDIKLVITEATDCSTVTKTAYSLTSFIYAQRLNSGDATVCFESKMNLFFHLHSDQPNSSISLEISGLIKITSPIKFITKKREDA